MASPIQHVSAFFIASLLLFLSCPSLGIAAQLIDGVCKNTINNIECLKILNSDPQARSASNYKVLAQAVLDLAIKNAKDSQAFINNLVKSDPREAIKDCASSYQAVVGSFNSAKGEIEEDPMTANYDSKIAGDDARECETSLSMKGVKVPEISARNNVVLLYSSIADVVTDHLE